MGADNCVKQEEMSTYQVQHATYDSAYHGFSNIGEVQKPNSYNGLYITNNLYAPRQHDCSSPSSLTNLNTSASSPPNSMGHGHSPAMLGSSLVPTPPTPNESPPTSTSQDDGLVNQGGSHPFIPGMDYRHPHANPPHHHHYAFHHLQGGQFPGPAGNGHGFLSGSLNHPTAYCPTQAALGAAAAAGIYSLPARDSLTVSDLPTSVVEHHHNLHHPQEDEDVELHRGTRPLPSYPWMKRVPQPSSGAGTAAGRARNEARTRTRDKYRVVYSEHQRMELEKEFLLARYVTIKRKTEMATQLNLSERQIKIWFQNRRAKDRKTGEKLKSNSSHSKISPAASCSESSPSGDQSVQQHVHALQHQQQLQQQQAHLMQMQAQQHQHHQDLAQHHNGGVATDNHLASLSSAEGFQHPEISIAPVPSCDPALRRDPNGSSATSSSVLTLGHPHVEQLSSSLSPESQMPPSSLQQHLQHQHLHQQHQQSQQQHVSYPMSHHHYNPYHQHYAPLARSSSTLLDFPSDFHVHHSMYGMNHFENLRHHHQQHLHQQQQPQLHHNSLQHHPNNSGQQHSQHHSRQQSTSQSVSVPMISAPGSTDSLLMHTDPSAISQNTTHDLPSGASVSAVVASAAGSQEDSKAASQLKQARHPKVKTEMSE